MQNWLKKNGWIVCLALLLASCGKHEYDTYDAVVRYTGDTATGGCGWVVEIDAYLYEPLNLPDEYKQEGRLLTIDYKFQDDKPHCFSTPRLIDRVYLHKITPK